MNRSRQILEEADTWEKCYSFLQLFQTKDNKISTAQGNYNSNRKPTVLMAWGTRGELQVITQLENRGIPEKVFPNSQKILIWKIPEILSSSVFIIILYVFSNNVPIIINSEPFFYYRIILKVSAVFCPKNSIIIINSWLITSIINILWQDYVFQ